MDDAARAYALRLGRQAIAARLTRHSRDVPTDIPQALRARGACFVTLRRGGELRGCVGTLERRRPLYRAIIAEAVGAALHDARFLPLSSEELPRVRLEISVLSPLRPVRARGLYDLLAALKPRPGVAVSLGRHRATLLPQVWHDLPEADAFVGALLQKAGLSSADLSHPKLRVRVYDAEHFGEN